MPGASIEGKNMVLCLYISFALVATVALVWNPFRVCGLYYYEYKSSASSIMHNHAMTS